jgi:hypothetical protein
MVFYQVCINYLALYIDVNINNMIFVGTYSLFVSLVVSFAPLLRSGANDTTQATNKQYALQKSCYCPIIITFPTGTLFKFINT